MRIRFFDLYYDYCRLDCIKRGVSDLLEIETSSKTGKWCLQMEVSCIMKQIIYYICTHKCEKNKVGAHCQELGENRSSACKTCNVRYKQQNIIPVAFPIVGS